MVALSQTGRNRRRSACEQQGMSRKKRDGGLFGQPLSEAGDLQIIKIVKLALRPARRHLADYSHEKSPKKYTQPQLFACLILRAHLAAPTASARSCCGSCPPCVRPSA